MNLNILEKDLKRLRVSVGLTRAKMAGAAWHQQESLHLLRKRKVCYAHTGYLAVNQLFGDFLPALEKKQAEILCAPGLKAAR